MGIMFKSYMLEKANANWNYEIETLKVWEECIHSVNVVCFEIAIFSWLMSLASSGRAGLWAKEVHSALKLKIKQPLFGKALIKNPCAIWVGEYFVAN